MDASKSIAKNAGQALIDQALKPGGLALTFAGLALALVSFFVMPEWRLPAQSFAGILIIWASSIWLGRAALKDALETARRERGEKEALALQSQPHGPSVLQAMLNPSDEQDLILLLQPSRLFGQSMLVSIYFEDERNFELLVASGRVANVQTNGLIQISVIEWKNTFSEVKRSVVGQSPDVLSRLLVRPAPTTEMSLTSVEAAVLAVLHNLRDNSDDE